MLGFDRVLAMRDRFDRPTDLIKRLAEIMERSRARRAALQQTSKKSGKPEVKADLPGAGLST